MSRDLDANSSASSALEFLERCAVGARLRGASPRSQHAGQWWSVRNGRDVFVKDLVREGVITDFQADRLTFSNGRGLVIGRYVILDRIGTGSMGWVYKARHQLMDRLVAPRSSIRAPRSGRTSSRGSCAR